MLPSRMSSPACFVAWFLLAFTTGAFGAGPVVYLGTSEDALELAVASKGPFFAELSMGQWQEGTATYAAARVGARTTGPHVFEISLGPATVSDCAHDLGERIVSSLSLGSGFSEGPLLLMFNMRYIDGGVRARCLPVAGERDAGELIGLAGIGVRF